MFSGNGFLWSLFFFYFDINPQILCSFVSSFLREMNPSPSLLLKDFSYLGCSDLLPVKVITLEMMHHVLFGVKKHFLLSFVAPYPILFEQSASIKFKMTD